MSYRFNPPPGWPAPPAGWTPPTGWQPDPSWPPAPSDWTFWVEEAPPAAPPGAPTGPQSPASSSPVDWFEAAGASATQQLPTVQQQSQPSQSQPSQTDSSAQPTQQVPTWHAGAYPAAPAPYSGDPVTQPFGPVGSAAPGGSGAVYQPGGYAPGVPASIYGATGQPGQPGQPGGSARPGSGGRRTGLILALVGGIVVLAAIGGVIALVSGGRDDDPIALPTSAPTAASPSTDPTTPAPSADPTSAAPSADPTSAAPGGAVGAVPPGYVEGPIGVPVELTDFGDVAMGTVTLLSVTPDAECNDPYNIGQPDGTLFELQIQIDVPADATDSFYFSDFIGMQAYSATGSAELGGGAFFCEETNPLPSEILPGASVTGSFIVDVPDDAIWIAYSPTYGLTDGAAWRIR